MDLVRTSLIGGAFLACLLSVAAFAPRVNAQTQLDGGVVNCSDGIEFSTTANCDLAIQKEVSVNGGPFFDANTSSEAVQGTVGDSIVYRLSVTNPLVPDDGFFPEGTFIVGDNFPAGATYVSASATTGSYDSVNHEWTFNLGSSTVYPVVLTINATANTTGLVQNIGFLSGYACDGDYFCEYSDSNNTNDSDQAWAEFSAPPAVLGDSATATPQVQGLADTGDSIVQSLVAGALIVVTLAVAFTGRLRTKTVKTDQ